MESRSWVGREIITVPHYLVKLVFTLRGQKKVWRNTRTSLRREFPLGQDFHKYLLWSDLWGDLAIDLEETTSPEGLLCEKC